MGHAQMASCAGGCRGAGRTLLRRHGRDRGQCTWVGGGMQGKTDGGRVVGGEVGARPRRDGWAARGEVAMAVGGGMPPGGNLQKNLVFITKLTVPAPSVCGGVPRPPSPRQAHCPAGIWHASCIRPPAYRLQGHASCKPPLGTSFAETHWLQAARRPSPAARPGHASSMPTHRQHRQVPYTGEASNRPSGRSWSGLHFVSFRPRGCNILFHFFPRGRYAGVYREVRGAYRFTSNFAHLSAQVAKGTLPHVKGGKM